jgi:hypothetical protein
MAKGDPLCEHEEIVRGLRYPYWSDEHQRGTPSAFTDRKTSVDRLAVLSLEEIIEILRAKFDHRVDPLGESMKIRAVGRARVCAVLAEAQKPVGQGKKACLPPVVLTVIEDSIENEPGEVDDPAHALICAWKREDQSVARRVPSSVANRLLALFQVQVLTD